MGHQVHSGTQGTSSLIDIIHENVDILYEDDRLFVDGVFSQVRRNVKVVGRTIVDLRDTLTLDDTFITEIINQNSPKV